MRYVDAEFRHIEIVSTWRSRIKQCKNAIDGWGATLATSIGFRLIVTGAIILVPEGQAGASPGGEHVKLLSRPGYRRRCMKMARIHLFGLEKPISLTNRI
jgi:hypothetical protein